MSFAANVKNELCRKKPQNPCCPKAECYGMLLLGRSFNIAGISLTTESSAAAQRMSQMTAEQTAAIVSMRTVLRRASHPASVVSVDDERDRERVLNFFGHTGREVTLRLNRANLENDCCWAAFLRGAFLTCGTVVSPQKDYRLEFLVPRMHLSRDLVTLLGELPMTLQPGVSQRKGTYVVYITGADRVSDLLTLLGAPKAAMEVMQMKMLREMRNHINRQTNFETANLDKTAFAAARQIQALQQLLDLGAGLEALPEDLRELAQLRYENPELSLRELGERLSQPLSRSGVNHRLQRITELAEKLCRSREDEKTPVKE